MNQKVLLLVSAVVLCSTLAISLGVPTAQCKVIWRFGIPCSEVYAGVVNQIMAWQIGKSCGYTGENCSYELISAGLNLIKASHTSPKSMLVNNLQYSFDQTTTVCKVMEICPGFPPAYTQSSWDRPPRRGRCKGTSCRNLCFSGDQGDSICEASTDPADNSTNYCGLQNVMNGSDLVSAAGYSGFSNKWICAGFDVANCTLS